jgi:hypothetical protein
VSEALDAHFLAAWRAWGARWSMFARCSRCGRRRGDDGRPLLVRGRRRRELVCLRCFAGGRDLDHEQLRLPVAA